MPQLYYGWDWAVLTEVFTLNSFGLELRTTLLGESHGDLVGVVLEGLPPGFLVDLHQVQDWLDRRRPGQSSLTTERQEQDQLVIRSGLFKGRTTGRPLLAYVKNQDVDSSSYKSQRSTPRPSHADYPAQEKYRGFNDYRGGGGFSGRITVGLVIAGAIARQFLQLNEVTTRAFTRSVGLVSLPDPPLDQPWDVYHNAVRTPLITQVELLEQEILSAKASGDSVGGVVECWVEGLPVGVGEPFFGGLKAQIGHVMLSIPSVKGVEFGVGFKAAGMRGSEHNDLYYHDPISGMVRTKTNNAGGVVGGLSTGMPLVFRVAVKPTSSIAQAQWTLDLQTGEEVELEVQGRHDPCIVPRVVPVVEMAANLVVLDLLLAGRFNLSLNDIS